MVLIDPEYLNIYAGIQLSDQYGIGSKTYLSNVIDRVRHVYIHSDEPWSSNVSFIDACFKAGISVLLASEAQVYELAAACVADNEGARISALCPPSPVSEQLLRASTDTVVSPAQAWQQIASHVKYPAQGLILVTDDHPLTLILSAMSGIYDIPVYLIVIGKMTEFEWQYASYTGIADRILTTNNMTAALQSAHWYVSTRIMPWRWDVETWFANYNIMSMLPAYGPLTAMVEECPVAVSIRCQDPDGASGRMSCSSGDISSVLRTVWNTKRLWPFYKAKIIKNLKTRSLESFATAWETWTKSFTSKPKYNCNSDSCQR